MSSGGPEALAHHVAKWHAREPEMALAEVFCPLPERVRFRAWGALQFELREALFELSDPRVTTVKLGWWAETLLALEQGQGRHPLATALREVPAPWSALARALLETSEINARPSDRSEAVDGLRPLSAALATCEAALFEATPLPQAETAIAVHLLLQRLPRGLGDDDLARVPASLLARHGLGAAQLAEGRGEALLRDWARELGAALAPTLPGACLYRRLRSRFDAVRLARLAAGRGFAPPPAPLTVWRGWRVARGG